MFKMIDRNADSIDENLIKEIEKRNAGDTR